MKLNVLAAAILFFLITNVSAQRYIEHQIVVQFHPEVDADRFIENIQQQRNFSTLIGQHHSISKPLNAYRLEVNTQPGVHHDLLQTLQSHPKVMAAGFDFQLEVRSRTPNDQLFSQQWDMEAINVEEVWECTTGGVTALGDTIVVAQLEGVDIFHEDLQENIWINHAEIPDDGNDNDQNGYTDDYYGWNVTRLSDNHLEIPHGTQVSGIIGARGDNDVGISGVNWNVKIMIVSTDNLLFSEIIDAYGYVLEMRKRYNETNGAEGAYVVATNASFGLPGQIEDDPLFPTWCSMYDLLGQEGVLSAGATSNDVIDIDINGDMPTSCPSDYLIAVTNVDQTNQLVGGYSAENIDIGAPGQELPATIPDDGYSSSFQGTSSATPHVSGGIALLYSVPCLKWAEFARNEPAEAALAMKSFLLDGAAPLESLAGMTTSGGLLDLKASMDLIQDFCGSQIGKLDILSITPNPAHQNIFVKYQTRDNTPYTLRIFNAIGQLIYREEVLPPKFELKEVEIDVSGFGAGVYFVSIENNADIVSDSFVVYHWP